MDTTSSETPQSAKIDFPSVIVPSCFVEYPNILGSWKYEDRRKPQKIDTNLWIGPLTVVKEEQFLAENNIRLLISLTSCGIQPSVVQHKYIPSGHFQCCSFDPGDKSTKATLIVKHLQKICDLIDMAAQENVSSLIYCESGNENSAVAAAAYLIHKYHYDMAKATQLVQSVRFSVTFDDVSKFNLITFAENCAALQSAPRGASKKSRMRDDDDENDENDIISAKPIKRKVDF